MIPNQEIQELLNSLRPNAQTLLLTLLENDPSTLNKLYSDQTLKTFLFSCEQMISQMCSETLKGLISQNPPPTKPNQQLQDSMAVMQHHNTLILEAEGMVMREVLAMTIEQLEETALAYSMEAEEA